MFAFTDLLANFCLSRAARSLKSTRPPASVGLLTLSQHVLLRLAETHFTLV